MPTDVIKKIGATNSPTTMDYSSISAWISACPPDLTVADERWIGECYDQGTLSGSGFGGVTTDSTRYPILRCAAGQGFGGKAGVRTTALNYNASGGVAIEATGGAGPFLINTIPYFQIHGLQVKSTSYTAAVSFRDGTNGTARIDACIFTSNASGTVVDDHPGTRPFYTNCLFLFVGGSGSAMLLTHGYVLGCTFISLSGAGYALHLEYNQAIIQNCAVFGFGYGFTDSTPASGSDYNATDQSSAVTGSHNQVSLTMSAQFVNASSDFRATQQISGNGIHNGTPDSSNLPVDVSGFTRDAVTPYIGCWEAAVLSTAFTVSPTTIPASHSGSITLTLSGVGTTWSSGSTVSVTNSLTGTTTVTKGTWTRTSNTAATLTVTTSTGAGTYKITVDGTDNSGTLTVGTATLAVSPTTGTVSTTPTLTLTGTSTVWTQETAAGLFTVSGVSGVSIATPTVTTDTAATAVLTIGTNTGTLTITDTSTGATCTFACNAVSGGITITHPVQWQTFQRNGSNQASIPISGTYTGGPGTLTIEASYNGGSYATIATGSGGNFSGTLSAQAIGQGTLTVRFALATGITQTVANVGIGDVFLIAGQSNAVGQLSALNSYSNGAGLKATCYGEGTGWIEGNDPFVSGGITGSPWPLLATLHMADQGVPCAFIQTAIGGRSLAAGNPDPWFFTKYNPNDGTQGGHGVGGGPGYPEITGQITNSGVNAVLANLWYQGENDVDGFVPREEYVAALITFADNIATDVAGAPKTFPIQLGYDGGGTGTPIDIRLAFSDAIALGGNLLGMPTLYDFSNDLHTSTNTHGHNVANRFWAALKSELFGGTSGEGHGPRVVACVYDSARTTITVQFDKTLKTGLTFATTPWVVTGNGSGATINSVTYNAGDVTAVDLTLNSAASLPILVSLGTIADPAGHTPPYGPDFTLPGGAGTINLPAEPFLNKLAAAEQSTGVSTGTGGIFIL